MQLIGRVLMNSIFIMHCITRGLSLICQVFNEFDPR